MSATICPTITATSFAEYSKQLKVNSAFAQRVHIDMMDGQFAPTKSPGLSEIWWPKTIQADLHLMFQHPDESLQQVLLLKPSLVIIHAEAEVHHMRFAAELHKEGIKAGLALLAETNIKTCEEILHSFDHVLIFSGNLGHQGGSNADMALLEKIKYINAHHPEAEIGWDGGINDQNIQQLIDGGVNVLNVGGFIQNSQNPQEAYAKLLALAGTND